MYGGITCDSACLTAQQTNDSMIPSSITSSSHSSTTGIMTYSVTNDQWMMCLLSSAITRKQYKQFLKKCYRQPLPDDDKLLKTASKHFIELAVISTEGITRKQADEFTKKSLHGLTEEILCKKSSDTTSTYTKAQRGW